VCCFPSKQLSTVYDIAISPDTHEDWPHNITQMVAWAFRPGERPILLDFVTKGRADARAWAVDTGVIHVAHPGAELFAEGKLDPLEYPRLLLPGDNEDAIPENDVQVKSWFDKEIITSIIPIKEWANRWKAGVKW
jgi:hypothetical protein